MLEAIAGYDPSDPVSVRAATEPYARNLERGIKGLRIGVARRYFYERLDPEVAAAVEAALGTLRGLMRELSEGRRA